MLCTTKDKEKPLKELEIADLERQLRITSIEQKVHFPVDGLA